MVRALSTASLSRDMPSLVPLDVLAPVDEVVPVDVDVPAVVEAVSLVASDDDPPS